jgi:hypothetical protein
VFLIVRFATGWMIAAVLTTLAVASTLIGCSSGGTSASGSKAVGQAVIRSSGLASALDQIPDIHVGNVRYTDWSMLGHQDRNDPNTASFAGAFLAVDTLLKRDLGIRSTDAQWELDVERPSRLPLSVLGFGPHTDLSGLAGKLTRLGFHADGSLFTGSPDPKGLWAYGVRIIGIDPRRHVLAWSADATAVRSVLAVPGHPLGRASEMIPLLTLASARLGRIATASIAVGPAACVKLTELVGRMSTPAELAAVRKFFHGTFTPPQAEITALAGPAETTALDALTFPDQRTAQANQASRSAASKVTSGIMFGGSIGIRVTGTAVTGRVLSFDMTARQPHDFPELVDYNGLGVDVCP